MAEHELDRYMYGWQRGAAGKEPKPDMLADGAALRGHQHGVAARRVAFEMERDRFGIAQGSTTLREMAPPELRAGRPIVTRSETPATPTQPFAIPESVATTTAAAPIDPLEDPMFAEHARIRARGIRPIELTPEQLFKQLAIAIVDEHTGSPAEARNARERQATVRAKLGKAAVIGDETFNSRLEHEVALEWARRGRSSSISSRAEERLVFKVEEAPRQSTPPARVTDRRERPNGESNGKAHALVCNCYPIIGVSDTPCPIHG